MSDHEEGLDLDMGPCCCCGREGTTVRNLVMLSRRAPVPGTGWGCIVCNLPFDGALYVACDDCVEDAAPPQQVISGFPARRGRAPLATLAPGVFEHSPHLHAFSDALLGDLDDD